MKSSVAENKNRFTETGLAREKKTCCDHVVQFYTDDTAFLDSLSGFIAEGFNAGESVIVIATASHRVSLEFRLRAIGFHVPDLVREDRYITADAEETLAKFMIYGRLDERVFKQLASQLLARAQKKGRPIRAFGEMVALLWAKGNKAATTRLEHLWNDFHCKQDFSLFCAYPRNGSDKFSDLEIQEICSVHSKVIMPQPAACGRPQS